MITRSKSTQIQLMRRTKIMISLPGSDIMNAVFMPDNSVLIVYCRYVDGRKESSNEIRLWYKYLRYLHTFEFCDEANDVKLMESKNVWVNTQSLQRVSIDKPTAT